MKNTQQPPESAETGSQSQDALCPLHAAMQELDRWQQLHSLIAIYICPALRTERAAAAAVTMACGLIPESQYSGQRDLLRRCACRERGDHCPLQGEAELRPFSSI